MANYLTQDEFQELYNLTTRISGLVQKFIEYLLKSDIPGTGRTLNLKQQTVLKK